MRSPCQSHRGEHGPISPDQQVQVLQSGCNILIDNGSEVPSFTPKSLLWLPKDGTFNQRVLGSSPSALTNQCKDLTEMPASVILV